MSQCYIDMAHTSLTVAKSVPSRPTIAPWRCSTAALELLDGLAWAALAFGSFQGPAACMGGALVAEEW